MTTGTLRARLAARRNYRAFERALQKADRYGGSSDLHGMFRRL